jgi:hypothetical protein
MTVALLHEPIAREQLREMRNTLRTRYINAIWELRTYEQETRNEEAMTRWRGSYPAWDRVFGCPATDLHARIAKVTGMVAGG